MPKYRFHCDQCDETVERYTSARTDAIPCERCCSQMGRLLPNIGSKKVTETVDKFMNVRQEEDQKKVLEARRSRHFWEVEVPRMVESGVYSTETCLAEGWLVYNERGELEIGKGPKGTG